MAFHNSADIIGFGGSAGGGKSDLALGLAITRHKKSLILRRESTQLRALIDRTREILGDRGRFNETSKVWRLPDNQQLEFGGCKDPGDEQAYRGRPHDLYVFDEADQFPFHIINFITAWLRTTIQGQKCQIILTFNPPSTAEGEWIYDFFGPWVDEKHTKPAMPGELRWYAMVDGKDTPVVNNVPFMHKGGLKRG